MDGKRNEAEPDRNPTAVAGEPRQTQLNAPVPLGADQTLGQSFTATAHRFTRVGGQFPTWNSANASMKLTLYAGTPATGLTEIGSREVNPVQDNGWA